MSETNKLIIANWKMNPQSKKEAEIIFRDISKFIKNVKKVNVVICPPFPFLYIKEKLKTKNVKLGGQDVFFEKDGSYTGEVSPSMLKNFGVDYVIVGHSERRNLGDTNVNLNKKLVAVIKSKMIPIFCVGEIKRDSNGFYLSFIKQQIEEGLSGVGALHVKNIIFAYEPVWAIGSSATREATPSEFIEIKIFIKKVISDLYGMKTGGAIKIIYGGSVNTKNAATFVHEGGADGLLVGRDSLKPGKFNTIINSVK